MVTSVEDVGSYYSVGLTDERTFIGVQKEDLDHATLRAPKVGDKLRLYMKGPGYPVMGMDLNDKIIFRKATIT